MLLLLHLAGVACSGRDADASMSQQEGCRLLDMDEDRAILGGVGGLSTPTGSFEEMMTIHHYGDSSFLKPGGHF